MHIGSNGYTSTPPIDPDTIKGIALANDSSNTRWSMDKINSFNLLCLDKCIYVPNHNNLQLKVLQYYHNHPLSGHFGMNHTLDAICQRFATLFATILALVQFVVTISPEGIDSMVYSNHFLFQLVFGIQSQWIL